MTANPIYQGGALSLNTLVGTEHIPVDNGGSVAVFTTPQVLANFVASAGSQESPTFVNLTLTGLLYESAANAITAAGSTGTPVTRATATQLTAEVNNITVSVTPTTAQQNVGNIAVSGVALPVSGPGLDVTVINSTANPIYVYPSNSALEAASPTINGIAASTGVIIPPNCLEVFECSAAGKWFYDAGVGYSPNGQLNTVLANDSIAANGTAIGTAVQLVADMNRITTCTGSNYGVILPVSAPGMDIIIENAGASPLTVYGDTTNTPTINGNSNTAGVVQMPGSVCLYTSYGTSAWYTEGLGTGYSGSLQTLSYTPTVAAAGSAQGTATALTTMVNRVSSATAGSAFGVRLPTAAPGMSITVINKATTAIQVYGGGTDTINGIATATGISQGINTAAAYICNVAGNWEVPISSLQTTSPSVIAAGAIPPHTGHTYVVTAGSAQALTLAAPTAGTDDGIEIIVSSTTAFAHTITATGLLQTGTAAVNVATFAAQAGAGVTLMAYNGKWIVQAAVGITFS